MSNAAFAALRKSQGDELAKLAEEHFKHDLEENDKAAIISAVSKLSTHALIGSVAGIGLGTFLAFRLRGQRMKMFQAFKASEKPTAVRFANGREEQIPDVTPLMKPSALGDIMTYTFFALGGLFIGGEGGVLTGTWSAKRTISHDPAMKKRIETAFKNFRVDVLKKEIEALEASKKQEDGPGFLFE